MLKYFFALFGLGVIVVVAILGFRGSKFKNPPLEIFPDMDRQPKVKAQDPSSFFADGRAARKPVDGTVSLGYSIPVSDPKTGEIVEMEGPYKQIKFGNQPDYYHTGKIGDQWGTGIPFEVTPEIMKRGQQRFNISCAVCHGASGDGEGVAKQYGLAAVADLHQQRLRDMADGEIFNTITHGKNTMMGYGHNIQVPDRWAIIAYVRALQLSRAASLSDVPADARGQLSQPETSKQ